MELVMAKETKNVIDIKTKTVTRSNVTVCSDKWSKQTQANKPTFTVVFDFKNATEEEILDFATRGTTIAWQSRMKAQGEAFCLGENGKTITVDVHELASASASQEEKNFKRRLTERLKAVSDMVATGIITPEQAEVLITKYKSGELSL